MGLGCWLFAIRVESSHDVTSSLTNNKPLAKGERKMFDNSIQSEDER